MLSGLLITLDILICIALIAVVLMQRSEGGAFGMGGGPTGLVTARGAGDLLTRTTWVLFAGFLVISLSLTLLGAHDRATSSIVEKLKLQHADPNALNQPLTPPAPTPTVPLAPSGPTPGSLLAPPPQSAGPAPAPVPANLGAEPAKPRAAHAPAVKPAAAAAQSAPSQSAPPPPVLEAPAPASSTPAPSAP